MIGIGGLAQVVAATASTAWGEPITIAPPHGEPGESVTLAGVVTPSSTIDPATGAPVVSTEAFALIRMSQWAALKPGMATAGPPCDSGLVTQGGGSWVVRAVQPEGAFWRLEMVEFIGEDQKT